jgi:adenylosuccinate synthase
MNLELLQADLVVAVGLICVALQFACMINGITKIVMTKADVLDAFKELQVCTAYKLNGKESREVPFQLERQKPEPVYKTFAGWNTISSAAKSYSDLPDTMKNLCKFH